MDLRLTVDYPEDLVLCRKIYQALIDNGPLIPLVGHRRLSGRESETQGFGRPYVHPMLLWPQAVDRRKA